MRAIQTITASQMRGINRSAILEVIRRDGPISRTAIAGALHVSLPTVMRIVEDLRQEGLVIETGSKEWSGGRKRALLQLNASEHLVIGIDMGGTKVYGAVSDLAGNVLHEATFEHGETSAEGSYRLLVDVLQTLITYTQTTPMRLVGAGIGIPGIFQPDSGVVRLTPSLCWDNFQLKARLEADFSIPIAVENDVNLAALGELWFGTGRNIQNLVLIVIGTGIGAGIVINGVVYPGKHDMAGEIGYLLPDRGHLGKDYSGFGALEQLVSKTGIETRARQALARELPGGSLTEVSAEDALSGALDGKVWAKEVFSDTVDYLAQAIGAICLIVDPEIILLGGEIADSADRLVAPILERLKGSIPVLPRLEPSTLGYRATALGAIVKLLRITSDFYSLQKIS